MVGLHTRQGEEHQSRLGQARSRKVRYREGIFSLGISFLQCALLLTTEIVGLNQQGGPRSFRRFALTEIPRITNHAYCMSSRNRLHRAGLVAGLRTVPKSIQHLQTVVESEG
jgi:hypothetical protein